LVHILGYSCKKVVKSLRLVRHYIPCK